ncbi:hypothetical protein TH63_00370 [Rufibacter radiotolerans]|uniref:Uncharacterized protein n=1 Tax=Rufibacter radiotolerans TaxID=1379910 RepID=A0A0H4VKZ4_9BACT|nr:hypothetical protein [Rufibacter radiotolerans]AKQ44439.1 hypothetical protein TH63_00370 [Rufibacter radiotolerans]
MLTAYYKLEILQDYLRQANKINSKTRLDCTLQTNPKNYTGLTDFVNAKGQMYFYKTPAREFVKANCKRLAEWALSNGKLNLSSIYFEDIDFPQFGYGYPNANRLKSNREPNPLFPFRNDAYLFITNADLSQVEVLVIAEGRNLVNAYYQRLIDGELDQEVQTLRQQAQPLFDYGSAI